MINQDKKNISSIQFITTNILSSLNNTKCGLDVSLKIAPILYYLYKNHLNFHPGKPLWINRDRFILAQGHAVAALYATLYHFNFNISKSDLATYAQNNSKLPIIPTWKTTPGIDATSYPLGQAIGQGVGMALGEKFLQKILQNSTFLDNYIFVLCIDESMHNGMSYEAMSFAGHFQLNNLIIINARVWKKAQNYQDTFSDDLKLRAQSINFNYFYINEVNDNFENKFNQAIKFAKRTQKPTLIDIEISMFEKISFESLMCYLKPLDNKDWNEIQKAIGGEQKPFSLKLKVKQNFIKISQNKKQNYHNWYSKIGKKFQNSAIYKKIFLNYRANIDLIKMFNTTLNKKQMVASFYQCDYKKNSYDPNQLIFVQEKISQLIPTFINGTGEILNVGIMQGVNTNFASLHEKNLVYGARDLSIPNIVNGMALYGGINPAFFIGGHWVDYVLPGIKTSAIQGLNILVVFNYTLESKEELSIYKKITEQIAILRSLPNLKEWRPIDAHETILAYNCYLKETSQPTIIVQYNKPVATMSNIVEKDFAKGGYILKKESQTPFKTVIASGGEMELVYQVLKDKKDVRLVSMPSLSTFRKQSQSYITKIIPNRSKTICFEWGNDHDMYQFAKKVIKTTLKCYNQNCNQFIFKTKNIIKEVKKL